MIRKINEEVSGYAVVEEAFQKYFGRIDEEGLFFGIEGTYIFTIKQKYDSDDDWEQITSTFEYSNTDRFGHYNPTFSFEWDFYEGEDEVYVIGIKKIEDLEVNGFDDIFESHYKGLKDYNRYEINTENFEEVE